MLLQAQSIDYNPLSQGNGAEYRKNFGGRSAGAMTEPDGAEDAPPTWAFDRSFLKPASRLCLNALDFSDLWDEEDGDEDEGAVPTSEPPAPPGAPPAPPPLPPPTTPAPPLPSASRRGEESIKCHTLRLHWRELQSLAPLPRMTRFGTRTIWETLEPVHLDTDRLEHLFKSKGSSSSFNVASGRQVRPNPSRPPSRCVFLYKSDVVRSSVGHCNRASRPPLHPAAEAAVGLGAGDEEE